MTPAMRLALCAVAVATGFSGGAVVGRAVGPLDPPASEGPASSGHAGHDPAGPPDPAAGEHRSPEAPAPSGLLMSESGYTLDAPTTVLAGVADELYQFRILGPDGLVVDELESRHERLLHLVVVARDLTTYHHLHPTLGADGTWSVNLPLLAPGAYHAFASFAAVDGPALTLGVGLLVPGDTVVNPLPPTGAVVPVDGYAVTLGGTPMVGAATAVMLTVDRDGGPVVDLEPYLGALGHLVALRAGDLEYTHVHPVDGDAGAGGGAGTGGPSVPFLLDVPSPGDYRLFFDFAHAGAVHTAAFTVHVPAPVLTPGAAP